MVKKADIGGKRLIGLAPTAWVQWVTEQTDISDIVQQIMRWDMTVLRESPWYQEILREGERQGEQRGRQEEGRSLILKQLNRQVGMLSSDLTLRIESLNLEQLEALGEALLDFNSLADLEIWLESHS